MKILEELWYGIFAPNDRDVPKGSRLHKLGALVVRHEENLMPMLSEQAKEVYEKLRDCQSELNDRFRKVCGWQFDDLHLLQRRADQVAHASVGAR